MAEGYPVEVSRIDEGNARDQNESRIRLGASMLDGQRVGDRSIGQAAGSDRAQFRDALRQSVDGMAQTLQKADAGMSAFNTAVQAGQLRPGSQEYVQAFQAATAGYRQAIETAAGQMFTKDASGQAMPSDMARRAIQERQTVEQEVQALRALARSGGTLTQDQALAMGLQTTDLRQALRSKTQDLMTLDDFQKALGTAEANFGLALIRSTANLPQDLKLQQARDGENWIAMAAQHDPTVKQDRNFWDNYSYVYNRVGLRPIQQIPQNLDTPGPVAVPGQLPGDVQGVPGAIPRPGDVQGLPPAVPGASQTNLRFNLPSGSVRPDSPGFVDPSTLIAAADRSVTGPLTRDNLDKYEAAMKAADSLDRNYLQDRIAQERTWLKAQIDGDQDGQLRARVQAKRTLLTSLGQTDSGLVSLKASVAQSIGPESAGLLDSLQSRQSVTELQQLMTQEAPAINAIRQTQDGQRFLQQVQGRVAQQERLNTLDGEIARINPQFSATWTDAERNQRLYMSSLDARAHTLNALVSTLQTNPENGRAAQALMLQMAQMDKGNLQRSDFLQTARLLGLTPDQLAGKTQAPGGDMPAGPALPSDDPTKLINRANNGQTPTPPERAAQLYRDVMTRVNAGQQISQQDEQAFQGLMQEAGSLNQDAIGKEAARLQQLSGQLGQGKTVEARLEELGRQTNGPAAVAEFKQRPEIKDYLDTKFRFNMVVHGQKVVEGLYGMALLRGSKDQDAVRRGAAYVTDANLDQFAQSVLPLNDVVSAISSGRRAPGDTNGDVRPSALSPSDAAPAAAQDPAAAREAALAASVPGYREYSQAVTTAAQLTANPQEALKQSQAAFEQALKGAAQINPADAGLQAKDKGDQATIARAELVGMTDQQANADPDGTKAKLLKYADLAKAADINQTAASLPTQLRVAYAAVLNRAAVDLYAQGGDKTKQADEYNNRALQLLREVKTVDPNYGENDLERRSTVQHYVDGAIMQAERHEKIQVAQGAAEAYTADATARLNMGLQAPFGLRGLQPLVAAVNTAGPVGELAGFKPLTDFQRGNAARDLAHGYLQDEATTAAAVEKQKTEQRTSMVHTAINLVSGPSAVYLAETVLPKLAAFVPANPLVKGAVSLAITGGLTYGLDKASNRYLGTTEFTNKELLSNVTASWGASWAIRGAMGLQTKVASTALEAGTADRALTSLSPGLQSSIRLAEGGTEAARAAQLGKEINSARAVADGAFNEARAAQYAWYNPARYTAQSVRVTEGMVKANTVGAELPAIGQTVTRQQMLGSLGIEGGSRVGAFLNPSNMTAGFAQRTLALGADGKLATSAADMTARRFYSTALPMAATGSVATAIYGTSEKNFWFRDDSVEDTARAALGNAAWGGVASGIAGPLVPGMAKMAGMGVRFTGEGVAGLSKWIAPQTTARIAESAPATIVKDVATGAASRVSNGWQWLTAGKDELGSILGRDASVQNYVNTYARGFVPGLTLPLAYGVTNYDALAELDKIDGVARRVAADIRADEKARQDAALAAQQQGVAAAAQPGKGS